MRSEWRGARSEARAWFALAWVLALLANSVAAATPFSFDDIEFWVGEGSQRAAVAMDWVEDSTEPAALVWGFRWDGAASGRDMLLAVLATDNRLFAKLGGTAANPDKVYGLGYDADDDGTFGIDDETAFDESGIAIDQAPFFPAMATDADDYYAEGWTFGFWHYGVASANPYDGGSWSDSGVGMASRVLTDGAWDSWAYTPTFDFTAFAEIPSAAAAPTAHIPGDNNGDGIVDATDYVWWRKHDGTSEGYDRWRANFGVIAAVGNSVGASTTGAPPVAAVSEPASSLFAAIAWCLIWFLILQHRKEKNTS